MNIGGQLGELRLTVEIKRAETGKVETYELIGHLENNDGSDSLDSGAECSDGRSNSPDRG